MSHEQAEVIELRTKLRRAMESGDDATAQEVAVQLAPFEEQLCEELDRNPAAITPQWGLLA